MPTPAIEIVPATEIAVAVLDADQIARLTGTVEPVAQPSSRGAPRAAIRTSVRTGGDHTATEPAKASSPGWFTDMRKGRDLQGRGRNFLGLSGRMLEHAPVPLDPVLDPTVEPTGLLEPAGRGRYRSEDIASKMKIAKDGTVAIKDKPNLRHQFTSLENVKRVLRQSGPFGLLQIDFDINDALMRRHHTDPYSSRKLKFLDSTRDERVQIGARYRQEQLARTPELVRTNLEVLWATVTDPRARKEGLFELWDDASEDGSEQMVAAGDAARMAVIGFIRARLPAGSAAAYTSAELAALNAHRHTRAVFAPYE